MTELSSDDSFVFQTMLTCIGNKRKLVKHIVSICEELREKIGKQTLHIMDGFTGSGVVARSLMHLCNTISTNDMELYAQIMSHCFLVTPTQENQVKIQEHIQKMNNLAENGPYYENGIIYSHYDPKDTNNIQVGERCFYTRENAVIIDTLRKYIAENVEAELQNYCLAPLLIKASIHANTAGVFKGFYKDGDIGCFGGTGRNALGRILKPITLDIPVWSEFIVSPHCFGANINELLDTYNMESYGQIDILYLDPPYNQHPYGSNYFMLNVIAKNEEPAVISKVSGIPSEWNKSKYNNKKEALESMKELIEKGLKKSKYLIISYNNEGIIRTNDWNVLFESYNVKKYEIKYSTYKGCRNLKNRANDVIEIMYLVSSI
jgi:adenine-specific DNA-methyltransferase